MTLRVKKVPLRRVQPALSGDAFPSMDNIGYLRLLFVVPGLLEPFTAFGMQKGVDDENGVRRTPRLLDGKSGVKRRHTLPWTDLDGGVTHFLTL